MDAASLRVDEYIAQNKVMIFSKSYCPFCTKAKQLLTSKAVEFFAIEMD